jgi:DNA-binding response OmpR family regulator
MALCPPLSVITVTGLANPPGEEGQVAKMRELGVKHFLSKPFSAEELLRTVHTVLEAARVP